jgi:ribonuclease-3
MISLNNEKLEFVGDAALDTVVSTIIYKKYPEMTEGELSKLRSAIVNEKSLSLIARQLDLGKYIILGRGEYKLKGNEKDSILANTLEALFGAVYIDCGLDHLFALLQEIYQICLKNDYDFLSKDLLLNFDAKTKLQEIVMQKYKVLPEYQFSEIKEGNQTLFQVECLVKDKSLAIHKSLSKKRAMQEIAAKIIKENILENHMEKLC